MGRQETSTWIGVDIGNTSIGLAVRRDGRTLAAARTSSTAQVADLRRHLAACGRDWRLRFPACAGVLICSVVPALTELVAQVLGHGLRLPVRVVGREIPVPIKNNYRDPSQVGQDRLVCAYAAREIYGKPVVVVDLGTAMTLDVVSSAGHYLGGIIVPGIGLSAETLFKRAALLPQIEIRRPRHLIGKDTEGSIRSGLFYGYAEMIQGLAARIARQYRIQPRLVLTGGYTGLIRPYIRCPIDAVDEDLVFRGLDLLWAG